MAEVPNPLDVVEPPAMEEIPQAAQPTPEMVEMPLDKPVPMVDVPIVQNYTPSEVHERGASAALVAMDNDRDPALAYAEATQRHDVAGMHEVWIKSTQEDRVRLLGESAQYMTTDQLQKEIDTTVDNLSGPVDGNNYIETIKAMPSSVGKSEEQIRREAVYMQLRETISVFDPKWDQMSYGDIAGTIGGVLWPKRKEEAYVDLMSKMGFIDSFSDKVDVFVDPTEEIMKMRNVFWSLDDEGQIYFMEQLAEHLPNSTDNPLIRQEIVNDILGGEFSEEMQTMFSLIDNVDMGLLTSTIVKLGKNMVRTGKLINVSKRLEEPTTTADIIKAANENPEQAAKIGVTQADVGDSLNPLINGEIGSLLTGASADQASATLKMLNLQEEEFKLVTEHMGRNGLWSRDELKDIMRRAEDNITKQPGVENAKVSMTDESSFKLEWDEVYHDSLGRRRKRSRSTSVDFTVNDLGELDARAILDQEWKDKGWITLDPNAKMRGMLRQEFVTDVEALARRQESTAKAFDNMLRHAYKGLSKKSAKIVDDALQHGARANDGRGATYTFEELTNGITGTKLTDAEARAYIGTRNVMDKLYTLKNKQITDTLRAQGVKVYDGAEGPMAVKAYDSVQGALTTWKQTSTESRHVLMPDGLRKLDGWEPVDGIMPFKSANQLTKKMVEQAYEAGYVLTRNHAGQNFFRKGDKFTQWAFVKRKNIHSPEGKQMLHRIEGYMPKQRKGSFYFIKKTKPFPLSGADNYTISETVAFSDDMKSAQKWVSEHGDEGYEIVFDRDMTVEERMYSTAKTHGGMYSGSRKSTELEYAGLGDVSFANSFEAMQHYINHIGRQYPATLYRLGAEARLVQLARSLGVKGRDLTMHNVARRALDSGFTEQSKEYLMLKGIQDQLSFVNMIPTQEELKMATRLRTIGRLAENDLPILKNTPKIFYNMAQKNIQPQNLIRGITFNHLLGFYNPAQILVQASGAIVSAAIDPIGFPKHVSRMIAWGFADNLAADPVNQKKLLKWMKENGLADEALDYELWTRSGFKQTVEQGNADYTSVFTKNMPYDKNILQAIGAHHTFFYKVGELINTRIAFSTAVDRYKKKYNVLKIDPKNDDALDEIGAMAEQLRLNMSRANQSDLNKGMKSVPFQFQQIVSKYMEKILPQAVGGTDELSSFEKFRLFAIPTALTGTAGLPMGNFLAEKILNMAGIDEKDMSPEEVLSVRNGALAWMINGDISNTDFSNRMSLSADYGRALWDALTVSQSWWNAIGGPFANVADRYWRNIQMMSEAFNLLTIENNDMEFSDMEIIPGLLFEIASDIPSVTRNMKQYSSHLFMDNQAFIKDGKYLWDWETMDKSTAFFGMMGFAPTEMNDIYELNKEIKDSSASFSTWGDTDADVILRILNVKMLDTNKVEESRLYAKIVNSMFRKYGPAEQRQLLKTIYNKASKRQYEQGNLVWKFLVESEARMETDLNILNTVVARHLGESK